MKSVNQWILSDIMYAAYLLSSGRFMATIVHMGAKKKTPPHPPKRDRKMAEIQKEFHPLIEIARQRLALKTGTAVVNQAVREFLERHKLWPPTSTDS